jgi:hypothetical protein
MDVIEHDFAIDILIKRKEHGKAKFLLSITAVFVRNKQFLSFFVLLCIHK